jgi:hypothetical protein
MIEHLHSEVEAWREESRRREHIIAGLVVRLPSQIEPPRELPGAPEMPAGGPGTHDEVPQEGSQRPWWARIFGK